MRTASPWRHPVSGMLYFRRAVPADLRPAVGRREIKISLDTKDPIEARLRFFRASLECEQLFREARLVSLEGWRPVLEQEVAADHDASEQVDDEQAPTVSQMHERWIEERRPAEQTVREWSAARRRFIELHGDLAITDVRRSHGTEFRRLLRRLPSRPSRTITALSAPRQAEEAERLDLRRLAPETVAKNLNWLKAILGLAVEEGMIPSSPVRGLSERDPVPAREKRKSYSIEQLNLIFASALYGKQLLPSEGQVALRPAGPHCQWLPLLALFTGARLEELAQIELEDLVCEEGVNIMRFSSFDSSGRKSGKRYKTSNAYRTVPLHPCLMDLGFLTFCERQRRCGQSDLFPQLVLDRRGKRSSGFSKQWGPFTRSIGIRDRRLSFHSFRHNFSDACDAAGVPAVHKRMLMGQSLGSIYGGRPALHDLLAAVERLSYRGLKLPSALSRCR